MYIHVLMRVEGRKKGQTNNKAKQHITPKALLCTCFNDSRRKDEWSNKQQGKATQHTQGSHFS